MPPGWIGAVLAPLQSANSQNKATAARMAVSVSVVEKEG
jgi:hypothetical protein